ncbi:STAS domain-containing protein [Falsiroseomonas sp. HW251]|uniref:STAS domain-containing protein n=1 Tax=Falsiroseomonas sp. HW251 TaxID=3390998 RepID=UPI003D323ED0
MEITETALGAARVIAMKGRLDTATAQDAEARIVAAIGAGQPVVADLAGVHYVSSAGLRVLLKAAKEAKAAGLGFALAAPQVSVKEVLEVSGFDKILPIHATVEAAVKAAG